MTVMCAFAWAVCSGTAGISASASSVLHLGHRHAVCVAMSGSSKSEDPEGCRNFTLTGKTFCNICLQAAFTVLLGGVSVVDFNAQRQAAFLQVTAGLMGSSQTLLKISTMNGVAYNSRCGYIADQCICPTQPACMSWLLTD